ncbi:MAG: COP23 domain-containing protein [Microcoleus sp.]
MTTKSFRLIPQIMAAVFTLFGMAACSTTTASAPDTSTQVSEPPTIFKCVQQGNGWATIAKRGSVTVSPLITWDTKEFGDNYTPEQRCKKVSPKLTQFVADNGGKLGYLKLIVGDLNNRKVVCVVNDGQKICNAENLLFTLNQKNSKNHEEVLNKIFRVGDGDATNITIEENGESFSILLENSVEPKLGTKVKEPKI